MPTAERARIQMGQGVLPEGEMALLLYTYQIAAYGPAERGGGQGG